MTFMKALTILAYALIAGACMEHYLLKLVHAMLAHVVKVLAL